MMMYGSHQKHSLPCTFIIYDLYNNGYSRNYEHNSDYRNIQSISRKNRKTRNKSAQSKRPSIPHKNNGFICIEKQKSPQGAQCDKTHFGAVCILHKQHKSEHKQISAACPTSEAVEPIRKINTIHGCRKNKYDERNYTPTYIRRIPTAERNKQFRYAVKITVYSRNSCDSYLKKNFLIRFEPFVFLMINFQKIIEKAYHRKTCRNRKGKICLAVPETTNA